MITENATTIPEAGKEKAAPVSMEGAGAMAPPWAETVAAIDRTNARKVAMMGLEMQA